MTVAEATAEGYSQCVVDGGCRAESFEDAAEYLATRTYWILDNEPTTYSISPDCIKEMVIDHVADQSDVADEDQFLVELVQEIPTSEFDAITELINKKLAERLWWPSIGIQLIP